MNATAAIALAALGIAVLTFIASLVTAGRGASKSYVDDLERKLEIQAQEIIRLENRIRDLEAENINLLRKLMANGGG